MAEKKITTKIQVRRDTTANWLTNKDVVPAAGEPCFDTDLGTLKVGDGVTTYENLKYIGGTSAAHYEGVKAEGESDNDVITRVLIAAGVTAEKDDIFVVKALIAGGKYSYTAYVYDGSVWAAMDGNYSAENVYFADDLTYTAAIGVLTVPSSGSGTIAASGKNVKDVLASILAKEKNPTATQPAVTITCKQIAAYEVGSKVTPAYTASLSAGSYTYGPATGITAAAWSVTDGTATKDTASGSFDELTVGDATSYAITAIATAIANKVDKVDGKGLSTEDFTTALKEKLVALPEGAEANYVKSVSDEFTVSAEGKLEVKEVAPAKVTGLPDALAGKVDKVAGKGLSANDYTNEEKEKLGGVEAGANKNLIEIIKLAGKEVNISEKAVDIPVAGETAGVVTSSTEVNKVAVAKDGSMEVNSLNMNKLVQSEGDTLILDGGSAAV